MARTRTLTEMIAEVRQRADMVNSTFVTDAEITRWINLGITKLYDLLIKARGNEYYLRQYTTSTSATDPTVFLPYNFYRLMGLDANYNGSWHSVEKLAFQSERNAYQASGPWVYSGFPYKYLFQGGNRLELYPAPTSIYSLRIWYLAQAPVLSTSTATVSLTCTGTTGNSYVTAATELGATQVFPQTKTNISGTPRVTDVRGTTIYLDAALGGTVSGTVTFDDPDRWDGINGWEEYVVLDAAIVAMLKEETDPSGLMSQKAEIDRRIIDMADSRDKGRPARLQDVQQMELSDWFYDDYRGW